MGKTGTGEYGELLAANQGVQSVMAEIPVCMTPKGSFLPLGS